MNQYTKRLQVLTSNGWEYVFCRSGDTGGIITTKNRNKAVEGKRGLEWFQSKFGNDQFRLV